MHYCFVLATTGKCIASYVANENVEDGVEEPLERVCELYMWWCFLPRHFHSWVDRKQLVQPLVRYYNAAAGVAIDNNLSTATKSPSTIISQKKSILQYHWQCCYWYCSENCRSSRSLARYEFEFVVAMMRAIKFVHAQYTTNQLKHPRDNMTDVNRLPMF